jgi:hypothetical protein
MRRPGRLEELSQRPENRAPRVDVGVRAAHARAVEMLRAIHRHLLLSTTQLRHLYTPQATSGAWVQRLARDLHKRGVVAYVQRGLGPRFWYLTDRGMRAVDAVSDERGTLVTPEAAGGPLLDHVWALNEVGIAFVAAARARGDDCGPLAWRHHVEHPRPSGEPLVAPAVVEYLTTSGDEISLAYRFVEIDRPSAPVTALVAKLGDYVDLHRDRFETEGAPIWQRWYRGTFPEVLVVMTGQDREQSLRRLEVMWALGQQDPRLQRTPVPIRVAILDDLRDRGPFAPIFWRLGEGELTDWQGGEGESRPRVVWDAAKEAEPSVVADHDGGGSA